MLPSMPPNIERLAFFSAVSAHFGPLSCAIAWPALDNATGAKASSPDMTKARRMTHTPVSNSRVELFFDLNGVNEAEANLT